MEKTEKNILIILNYKPGHGGITGEIEQLSKDLAGEGFNVEIVSTNGIKKKISGFFKSFLLAKKTDVILGVGCAYFGFIPIMYASIIAFLLKKRVAFNFHDGLIEVFLNKYLKLAKFFIGNEPVAVASGYLADTFKKYGFHSVEITNHFDFSESFPGRNEPYVWNKKILWSRAFHDIYQPELALKAAHEILKRNYSAEFYFYGKGPLLAGIKKKYSHKNFQFISILRNSIIVL